MPTELHRFYSIPELEELPPPDWLIEGLIEKHSLAMLAGAPGSFKSFLLVDWMACLASGRKWNNRSTIKCNVGYALGEGRSGVLKRLQAWIKYNDPTLEEYNQLIDSFRITFEVPQLASKASVDNMLADLEYEGFKPDVIAIDTFARSFVGMDENDAKDAGLWVEQADRLRQLGYTVIFLHHTRKNTEIGQQVQYRGSSAVMGAMDTAMQLARKEDDVELRVTKQKEHDEGPKIYLRKIKVGLGGDESCVLIPAPLVDHRFKEGAGEEEPPDTPDMLNVIDELLRDESFESNRARGRALMGKFPLLNEHTATSKIQRRSKRVFDLRLGAM